MPGISYRDLGKSIGAGTVETRYGIESLVERGLLAIEPGQGRPAERLPGVPAEARRDGRGGVAAVLKCGTRLPQDARRRFLMRPMWSRAGVGALDRMATQRTS